MRFLKSMRAVESAEKTAIRARLDAIANRSGVEQSTYESPEPLNREVPKRLFGTPAELAAEPGRE